MGLGVRLVGPDGSCSEKSSLAPGHGCNNEAELHALCLALELAAAAGARRLLLRGDSKVAVSYVTGAASTGIARLLPLIARARECMAPFDEAQLVWVPRHRNAAADQLSRAALGLPPSPPVKRPSRIRR